MTRGRSRLLTRSVRGHTPTCRPINDNQATLTVERVAHSITEIITQHRRSNIRGRDNKATSIKKNVCVTAQGEHKAALCGEGDLYGLDSRRR
ncbi:hypothetical protein K449DRAFT_382593 [Hypoxylon sp. EC38]|nr:hypothetical protein K449DRAFT_382593 [Hypoxylon sp. EC38]